MNIVFGGSFNPITKAHEEIAKHLVEKFNPKKLYFLPVGNDYSKPDLVEGNHRINMINLICTKDMEVLDYEVKNKYEGTYNTLKNLNLDDVYFVMGYDNLRSFRTWNDFDKLINEFKFILVNRPGCEKYKEEMIGLEDRIIVVDDISLDISSSMYRESKNTSLLNTLVANYIKENHLYE